MKLFITNKSIFESEIELSKEVHKRAYNHLLSEIEQQRIPTIMLIKYRGEYDCIFKLKSVSESGIYFFEYDTIIN